MLTKNKNQAIDLLCSRPETDGGEKEKSIETKSLFLLRRFFCGRAYLTNLIGHIPTMGEPQRKDKTISFQSINKESMIKRTKLVTSLLWKP